MSGFRLSGAEKALLRAWRRSVGTARRGGSGLDPVERQLLNHWRHWRHFPATRPPWAAAMQHRFGDRDDEPEQRTGIVGERGPLPEAPSRLLGMLLGGAVGESVGRGDPRDPGERTTVALFVLEGLIRGHARMRAEGDADPADSVLAALQRWLHTRGLTWADCTGDPESEGPDGWLVQQPVLRTSSSDDPTVLTALARVAAGHPAGTRQKPVNYADSASAIPPGAFAALWSGDSNTVFGLATDLAALTHGHPHGHYAAGFLGSATYGLLRGRSLYDSIGHGLAKWPQRPRALVQALRLGRNSPVGYMPGRAHLDAMRAMNPGHKAVEALGVAIRVALSCPDDLPKALDIAADQGGDSATAAMVCGQLLGALHGPTAVPARQIRELPVYGVVERLVDDATVEFGPHPSRSPEWERRYPALEVLPAPPELSPADAVHRQDRFLGAVLGGAIGEALGQPITGDSWEAIKGRHGESGLTAYVPAGHPSGRLGSDSQLLLFSLEGTIRANVARRREGVEEPTRHVQHAYQRWLHTQHLSWNRAAGEFLERTPKPDGWLVDQRALFQTRNPGRTMMRTLIAFAKGQQAMGSPQNPVSDSRGSSSVLRAVPAALWSSDPAEVFKVAARTAALTHGAAGAYLTAGTLGCAISRLVAGDELATAVERAREQLRRYQGHEEVEQRIGQGLRLAENGPADPATIESALGTGWLAPDALAIALHAAVVAKDDVDRALALAVNHSGNSATTGAIAGSLVAAAVGAEEIPDRWLANLELREVIERLVHDAGMEFGSTPPSEEDWFRRYPPT